MRAPLRVGLVGLGWVNREVWLPRLLARRDCHVVAACDPAMRGVPVPGAEGTTIVGTTDELLGHDLDLALVATPNHLHRATASAMLGAGVATVVEKPLCLSSAEFDSLTRLAVAHGAPLQASRASARRWDVLALRSLVNRYCVGSVDVRAEWLRAAGVPRPGSWFTRRAEAGGGALLDLGWHLADATLGMVQGTHPVELSAWVREAPIVVRGAGAAWRADGEGGGGVDVEVDGGLRGVFADGSTLTLRAAWISEVPVDTTRIEVRGRDAKGTECRIELVTTFGFSPHRVTSPVLRVERAGSVTERRAHFSPGQEYDDQLDATVAMAGRRMPWRTELIGSAAVMRLMEDAYRAAGVPLRPGTPSVTVGATPC